MYISPLELCNSPPWLLFSIVDENCLFFFLRKKTVILVGYDSPCFENYSHQECIMEVVPASGPLPLKGNHHPWPSQLRSRMSRASNPRWCSAWWRHRALGFKCWISLFFPCRQKCWFKSFVGYTKNKQKWLSLQVMSQSVLTGWLQTILKCEESTLKMRESLESGWFDKLKNGVIFTFNISGDLTDIDPVPVILILFRP